jgi:hypothetical protein
MQTAMDLCVIKRSELTLKALKIIHKTFITSTIRRSRFPESRTQ